MAILNTDRARQIFTASTPTPIPDNNEMCVTKGCEFYLWHKGLCGPKPRVEVWYKSVSKHIKSITVPVFKVCMTGKTSESFNHWRDAVAHAVYVRRNPHVMHDLEK